jgi:hypothetical protein
MDYTQLIAPKGTPGSVATWLNDSRVQGDVPEIVLEAESWIYRRLRHWKMLTPPVPGTFTTGQDFILNPPDMLEPFMLTTTGIFQQIMRQTTPQEVVSAWAFDGSGNRVQQQPLMFYFDQSGIRFDSPPDQAYAYALIYYQQPQALAVSVSNFLTATYPRLLRLCCMAAGCEWMKDSGQGQFDRTYWDTLAQDEIEKAQEESDRARRGVIAGPIFVGGGTPTQFPAYVQGW